MARMRTLSPPSSICRRIPTQIDRETVKKKDEGLKKKADEILLRPQIWGGVP